MVLSSCKHHVAGVGIFSAGFSFALVQIFPYYARFLSLGKGILVLCSSDCLVELFDYPLRHKVLAVVFSNEDTKD